MRTIRFTLLGAAILVAAGCGGKAAPATTPTTTPAATPATPADSGDLSLKGEDKTRMCEWYASSVADQGDEVEGDPKAECHTKVDGLTAAQRQEIADCMNACGDSTGVVHCVADFGTDGFPACSPETVEDEGDGDGSDE